MKKILFCVGTRPNLIKITQFDRLLRKHKDIDYKLLHTGQHYDYNMNKVFFEQLGIREPDIFLNINKGSQISVVSQIMIEAEKFMKAYQPDLVVVPGDVNSTFACGFVARYLGFPLAHLESGLRSFDKTMPEENNRILVDGISDYYFVTEPSGEENLLRENVSKDKIFFVGNTMIDTLFHSQKAIDENKILDELQLNEKEFILSTFHRPANVDNKESIKIIVDLLIEMSKKMTVVFPIHPRTKNNMEKFGFMDLLNKANIKLANPLGYFEFMKLLKTCKAVVTDSGGIQEETTYLRVPCLTIRPNTERPVTITQGTNTLLPLSVATTMKYIDKICDGTYKTGEIPKLWDGKATERIVDIMVKKLR